VNTNDIMDALEILAALAIVGLGMGVFFAALILPIILVLNL